MENYKNTVWVKNNSLANEEKQVIVLKKMEFWGINCKLILFRGEDSLRFTINNTEYTVIVDEYSYSLKVLAQNKVRNKSGHESHYIKDKKTGKHMEFKGNNCWDDLIRWAKKLKNSNKIF